MKKQAALLALTITLGLLCGCKSTTQNATAFSSWRQSCLSAETHKIEAEVTASDEENAINYTLSYVKTAEEETIEVLSPELIATVKAHLKAGASSLEYDGAVLDTGSALSEILSPMMALPTFMDIIEQGHTETVWQEKKDGTSYLVTELEMPDGIMMTLWLCGEPLTPAYAEIRSADKVEVTIKLNQYT